MENKIIYFQHEYSRLEKIADYYVDKYEDIFSMVSNNIVSTLCSRGGVTIHRGYFCPSLVYDIYVGNANRGNLLKAFSDKATYFYKFDKNNQLIMSTNKQTNCNEFIFYNNQVQLGISYNHSNEHLEQLSECEFANNRIIKYKKIDCLPATPHIILMYEENYTYTNNKMFVDCYTYFPNSSIASSSVGFKTKEFLQIDSLVFKHNNGFLTEYEYTHKRCDSVNTNERRTITVPITVKRKI